MYINWDAKVIYLASPRTASVSTSDGLMKYSGFERFKGHHASLEKAGCIFDTSTRSSWTTITAVRNHWDAVVSWMFWARKTPPWTVRDMEKGLATINDWTTFNRLFSLHLDCSDIIWRFESLPADIERTFTALNLTIPALERRNVSDGRDTKEYRDYYTPDTQQYVADRYAAEIKRLGYTF